jgi:hypothetical protein
LDRNVFQQTIVYESHFEALECAAAFCALHSLDKDRLHFKRFLLAPNIEEVMGAEPEEEDVSDADCELDSIASSDLPSDSDAGSLHTCF